MLPQTVNSLIEVRKRDNRLRLCPISMRTVNRFSENVCPTLDMISIDRGRHRARNQHCVYFGAEPWRSANLGQVILSKMYPVKVHTKFSWLPFKASSFKLQYSMPVVQKWPDGGWCTDDSTCLDAPSRCGISIQRKVLDGRIFTRW